LIGHLAAAARKEGSAIERDRIFAVAQNSGIEFADVAIGMIQEIGVHGDFLACLFPIKKAHPGQGRALNPTIPP
jgi:hypothetical protein